MDEKVIPNPGSHASVTLGCLCPILDNEHGRGIPYPRMDGRDPVLFPSFYVNDECPLHGGNSND